MKLTTLCLFILPVALSAQLLEPEPKAPAAMLRQHVVDQRVDRAATARRIAIHEAAMKQEPGNPLHTVRLADAYIQMMRETTDYGYLDRAEKLTARVLAKDPAYYDAIFVQTQIDLFRHKFTAVATNARKLAERQPKDAANWAMLGDALMEMGQLDPAADAYQKMVDIRPDLMSYNRIGWFRFITGDIDGAIQMMARAVRAGRPGHENTAWCLVELGNLYLKSGKLPQAASAYQLALQNFSGMHSAHAGIGHVLAAQGKTEEAVASFKKAQAMAPMIDYAGALADLYESQGKKEEARRQLETLDLIAKMEAASGQKANRQLALIFANYKHNLAEALDIAAADLKIRKDVYTWDAYAWVLLQSGKLDEAAKAADQALANNTPEPQFYYHAGIIAKANGDNAKGNSLLKKALELNPNFETWGCPPKAASSPGKS